MVKVISVMSDPSDPMFSEGYRSYSPHWAPRISRVEEAFAKKYGWTPDRASRVWERNPAYAARQAEFANLSVRQAPTTRSAPTGARPMGKITWHLPDPSDPMYKEGYRSYSPYWVRGSPASKRTSLKNTDGRPTPHPVTGKLIPPVGNTPPKPPRSQ
jgi:hypothetical protein